MLNKIIKSLIVVSFILLLITGTAFSQDVISNTMSYIKSEESAMSFFLNLKKLRNIEIFKNAIDRATKADDENLPEGGNEGLDYYNKLKEYGIDVSADTDLIFFSADSLPVDNDLKQKDMQEIGYFLLMAGKYPTNAVRSFLLEDDFKESKSLNQFSTFSKDEEKAQLSILYDSFIVVTPQKNTEDILSKLVNGNGINKGNISEYVEEAEEKYDLAYFVMNLESLDKIDITSFKEENKSGPLNASNLPDELKFLSTGFGMYTTEDGGFNFDLNLRVDNDNDAIAVHQFAVQLVNVVKGFAPMIIGSMAEENKTEDSSNSDDGSNGGNQGNGQGQDNEEVDYSSPPKLSKEQQTAFQNFIYGIEAVKTENNISITIKFTSEFLTTIIEILDENY